MNFPDHSLPPIIIVDDSQDDAFLLRYRLRMGEIPNPLVTFESARSALDHVRLLHIVGGAPWLLFTDIRMPGGFELIARIRENSTYDDMKVVVNTYSNDPADLKRALNLRVDGYVLKFPDPDFLADFVRNGPWFDIDRPALPMVHALCA